MFCAVHVVLNLDISYSGYRPLVGCCEKGSEFSGSTKKKMNLLTSEATAVFSKISQLHRVT